MIIQIRIPDELYAHYAERNPKRPQEELEKVLHEAKDILPGEQRILFSASQLRALKDLLEHPVSTAEEVLERIKKFKRVALPEGAEVELDEGQLTRLKAQHQASGFNMSFQDFVKRQLLAGLKVVL